MTRTFLGAADLQVRGLAIGWPAADAAAAQIVSAGDRPVIVRPPVEMRRDVSSTETADSERLLPAGGHLGSGIAVAIHRGMNARGDQGFTLIELIIVVAIIAIIAAIAVPGLLRARMTANETSAIASLKVATSSQVAYTASCGRGAYATTFIVLGTPVVAGSEAFISADLGSSATPLKSGYNFTLGAGAAAAGPNDCLARATYAGYYATATPQLFGVSGSRVFAVNAGNTVWQSTTAAVPTEPFTVSATVGPVQ